MAAAPMRSFVLEGAQVAKRHPREHGCRDDELAMVGVVTPQGRAQRLTPWRGKRRCLVAVFPRRKTANVVAVSAGRLTRNTFVRRPLVPQQANRVLAVVATDLHELVEDPLLLVAS
jgi:hypothetical protein